MAQKPDPEIERSNKSHAIFIDILTRAFKNLGGDSWKSRTSDKDEDEDLEDIIFSNKFSTLGLGDPSDAKEGEEQLDEDTKPVNSTNHKASNGKKKKGKKGKKGKTKSKPKMPATEALDDVPLESYRIIEDDSGMITDYLMAVYSIASLWSELRSYLQGLWRQVAYAGLNSAVAGTMSNIAIASLKKTESAVFVDFPGHDSDEVVMNTLTRGDPEKAQSQFSIGISMVTPDGKMTPASEHKHVDAQEQFMFHAYRDLVDLLVDFRHTRSGKPTKSMMAQLRNWDPNFNLQTATKEERIKWRRAYTINWLYDLVNVFSSVVVQRVNLKGETWVMEKVDVSVPLSVSPSLHFGRVRVSRSYPKTS